MDCTLIEKMELQWSESPSNILEGWSIQMGEEEQAASDNPSTTRPNEIEKVPAVCE